jgi:hypothetical protein
VTSTPASARGAGAWPAVGVVAIGLFVAHIVVNATTQYGVHRDEFLYMAMGEHLRLFAMDFPPFIALAAIFERGSFGDSLVAIRLLPALAASGLVVLAAAIARDLGGGRLAQSLAALFVAVNALFLRPGTLFQPVVFDQFWWTLTLFALVRLRGTRDPRWWIAIGIAGGLGLLTKFSILILGFGILVALLIDAREEMRTRGPWLALGIALVIGAPSLVGQLALGWPLVNQMRTLQAQQLMHVKYGSFFTFQLRLGPATLVALAGLIMMFRDPAWRAFRVVGLACATAFLVVLVAKGKPYYVGPIYPALLAAGCVQLERLGASRAARLTRAVTTIAVLLYAAFLLPFALPILRPELMARYAAASGLTMAVRTNYGTILPLPQDYADMLGWRDRALLVRRVFDSLPAEKRAQVVLAGENYGEAGALDFYGPRLGLPRVVSAHGSYWFFGPGDRPGTVLITLGISREDLLKFYDEVTLAAHAHDDWLVDEEKDIDVYVCERPRTTLQAAWPGLAGRN